MFVKPNKETEIYVKMLRSDWWGHLERNFHDKAKPHIKKIIEIYYMFNRFDEGLKFGIRCYRKETEEMKLVFEKTLNLNR